MLAPWKSTRIAKDDLRIATESLYSMERSIADIRDRLRGSGVEVDLLLEQLAAIRTILESERKSGRTTVVLSALTLGAALVQPVAATEYQRWREGDGVANNPPPPVVVFDQTVTNITRIYAMDEIQVWQGSSVDATGFPQPGQATTQFPSSVATGDMTDGRDQASGSAPDKSPGDWLDRSTSAGQFFDGPGSGAPADESSE